MQFSECENNGQSGNCSPDECSLFWQGDCTEPSLPLDHMDLKALEKEDWQQLQEVYPETYELFYTNFKKETEMNRSEELRKMKVQQHDRTKAAKKLEDKAKDFISHDLPAGEGVVFDHESCKEIFSDTINVPVKVVCLETDGTRKVFVNGFEIHASNLCVLASASLIKSFGGIEETVAGIDGDMGCENLSKLL